MPTPSNKPTATDDERIRQGLKFLYKADRTIIRAAVHLEQLAEIPFPQGPDELLQRVTFKVGKAEYVGKMTEEQADYLDNYRGSVKQFADAVSRVILNMDQQGYAALIDLSGALVAPPRDKESELSGGITPPPTGCCYFDNTHQDNVTESYCKGGLLGSWDQNPCRQEKPEPKAQKK